MMDENGTCLESLHAWQCPFFLEHPLKCCCCTPPKTLVQRMRATQEAYESEAKEEEFYLKAMVVKVCGALTLRERCGEPYTVVQLSVVL